MKDPCKECLIRPICIRRDHDLQVKYPKSNHSYRMMGIANQCKFLQQYIDSLLDKEYEKFPDMTSLYVAILNNQVELPRVF